MSEATLSPIVDVKNPVIVVNGFMNPRHAILADFLDEQKRDIHFFENIQAYLGTVDRRVGVGYYTNQSGSSEPYTHSPLEPSQIISVCPNFEIENYHTSFLDLLSLMTASPLEQQLYNAIRPSPSVRENLTWCCPENLKLDLKIASGGHSRFEYSALGLILLNVNSNVDSFRNKLDVFRPFISLDDTGCYQEATAEVLEQRIQKAIDDAGKIDGFHFRYRFKESAESRPYNRSLKAAKNVAARMSPFGKVSEKEVEETYDAAWNVILQQRLPEMVRGIHRDLSVLLKNSQADRSAPFWDTYSHSLDIIVDRLKRKAVSLDEASIHFLGEAIVLNNLYEQAQNQNRVDRIRYEIGSNQEEIRELARRSGELVEEMKEVQTEVSLNSRNIEGSMKKRLEQMFGTDRIDSLIRNTRPLDIPDEPCDEIPF